MILHGIDLALRCCNAQKSAACVRVRVHVRVRACVFIRPGAQDVIHVKRAKRFDPIGWFEVPCVSRKWIAGRFGVGLSHQNKLWSEPKTGQKIAFIYVKSAKAKDNVISYLGVLRVRND